MPVSGLTGVGDIVAYLGVGGQKEFESALGAAGGQSDKLARQINTGLTAAIVAGAGAFTAMTLSAGTFQAEMANVNTLLDGPKEIFSQMNSDLLELAQTVPSSMSSLTGGLYDLVSAGAEAGGAVDALGLAAQAATAGITGVDTAVNAGMGNINAYGLDIEELGRVFDIQFSTVKNGVLTYEELAGSLGTVLPAAKTLNVSIADLYGSIAFLTKNGQSADQATTNLSRAFEGLVENKENLKKFGIQVFDAAGKFRGMEAIVSDLSGAFKDMTDEERLASLETVNFDIRAGRAINTMINNFDDFSETLGNVADSTGAMGEAFDKQMDSLKTQADKFKNIIQTSFIKGGTEVLIPALQSVLTELNQHPGAIETVVISMGTLAISAGGLAGIIKGGMGIKALTGLLGPWGVGIAGVTAAYVAINTIMQVHHENQLKEIDETSKEVEAIEKLENRFNALWNEQDLTNEQQAELNSVIQQLKDKYAELGLSVDVTSASFANMNQQIAEQKLEELKASAQGLEEQIKTAGSQIETMTGQMTSASGVIGFGGSGLSGSISGLTEGKQKLNEKLATTNEEIKELEKYISKKSTPTINDNTSAVNTLKESFDNIKPILTDHYTTVSKGAGSLYELAQKEADWNSEIKLTSDGIAVLNTRFPEFTGYITELKPAVEHSVEVGVTFGDMLSVWIDQIGGTNGALEMFQELGEKFGFVDENAGTLIDSVQNIATSGFNPFVMGFEAVNIAMSAFNDTVTIAPGNIQDVIDSMGGMGTELQGIIDLVNEFNSKFESDRTKQLEDEMNLALQMIADLEKAKSEAPALMQEKIQKQIDDWKNKLSEAQEELDKMLAAFEFSNEFEGTTDQLDYLIGQFEEMYGLFGSSVDYSGLSSFFQEAIAAAEELMSSLDPNTEAWKQLQAQIQAAKDALNAINGTGSGGGTLHNGGLVTAHSGMLMPNETMIKALKDEYVLRPDVVTRFGKNALDSLNQSLNPMSLNKQVMQPEIVVKPVFNPTFVVNNQIPINTTIEYVDNQVQPRLNYKDRKLSVKKEPFKI